MAARATELLTYFPAVELAGARQVGKSTLARMLAASCDTPVRAVSLDEQEALTLATTDPRGFLTQVSDGLLIIDEFQRAPGLGLALKALIDADRRPGRFLITGSVNLSAKQKNSDSLAGRVVGAQVRGFS